ncbi:CvpA family protein [Rickettsiella grylli]|uniref:CvpA family protein n=1 Tax=Rickettsiella grylli TaxID=59196 RepID=A8PMV6_9COXI|nr:CvpA family protein [Rickettsiella grylli]EDP45799.1 CvpA family protein [Rickettsiella grylli]
MSTFNWIDYTIIAIIALSVLISVMRGFVREVISLVIWVAAIAVSFIFYRYIADLLVNFIHSDSARLVISFVGLFLVTLVLGMLINYLISQLVANTGLSGTDRVLGIIFGISRGILVVVLLMMLIRLTPFAKEETWQESVLVPHFQALEDWLRSFLPPSLHHSIDMPQGDY